MDWNITTTSSADDGAKEKNTTPACADVGLGVFLDLMVHILYAFCLLQLASLPEILLAIVIVVGLSKFVFFNKKFAWSDTVNVPNWVRKRVKKLY